jgi:polyvinyl alcohol dehydrogenase (cytochrome)
MLRPQLQLGGGTSMASIRVGLVAVGLAAVTVTAADAQGLWPLGGRNVRNTRHQRGEREIDVVSAASLQVKWAVDTDGDISATPAVDATSVYVPDWAGKLYAFNRQTGALRWSRTVASLTGVEATCQPGLSPGTNFARATPAIADRLLILGDQGGRCSAGARVFAVDKHTGRLKWVTQVDSHFAAIVTQPATIDQRDPRVAYVGVASMEEALAAFIPGFQCCTFRGSVVALDTQTGRILWKTYTVPNIPGYSGNGVWGSMGAIDRERRLLFVATGNNYSVPAEVSTCVSAAATATAKSACMTRDNYFDSVLALDLRTGRVRWASFAQPFDAWNLACMPGFANAAACPPNAGPDYDFAQGPMLYTIREGRRTRDVVGAGQKSGVYWTFDRDTGAMIWNTQVGPGGTLGGLQWGSAVDGTRVYTQINNNGFGPPWTLRGGPDAGTDVPSFTGFFSALDAVTGQILWQTRPVENGVPFLGGATGPVTSANGVVFACSFGQATLNPDFSVSGHREGAMYAIDAARGSILWRYPSGDFCAGGAAVSRGMVFWGTGYAQLGVPNLDGGGKLYAFGLP